MPPTSDPTLRPLDKSDHEPAAQPAFRSDTHLESILGQHKTWLQTHGILGRRADLSCHDLQGATLPDVDLRSANLRKTRLWHANLQRANLQATEGLEQEALAGADLANALLPFSEFPRLAIVKEIVSASHTLFVSVLLACIYVLLTITTTTTAQLFAGSPSAELPIVGVQVQLRRFYIAAPAILLALYMQFHFYIARLFSGLSRLPAVFPDGTRLDEISGPWIGVGLVRSHFPNLRKRPTILAFLEEQASAFFIWRFLPLTIAAVWLLYLRRQDLTGSLIHALILLIAIVVGRYSRMVAAANLDKRDIATGSSLGSTLHALATSRLGWQHVASVAIVALLTSIGTVRGCCDETPLLYRPCSWAPAALRALRFEVRPDLRGARFPADAGALGKAADPPLLGVDLRRQHLRYALAEGASMSGADLRGADLEGIDLTGADLRAADLRHANLTTSRFNKADLRGARLEGANLADATLDAADLRGATLRGVRNWRQLRSLNLANLEHLVDAPEGFGAWALDRGGVQISASDEWDALKLRAEGNLTEALHLYRRAETTCLKEGVSRPELPGDPCCARLAFDAAEGLRELGHLDAALASYTEAARRFRSEPPRIPSDTDARHARDLDRELARVQRGIGEVRRQRNEDALALEAFELAENQLRRALTRRVTPHLWHAELAMTLRSKAQVLAATARRADSHDAYRQAIDILERIRSEDPGNTRWDRELARTARGFAQSLAMWGQFQDSLKHFRLAESVLLVLASRPQATIQDRRQHALIHTGTANLFLDRWDLRQAWKEQQEAHAAFLGLVETDPLNSEWQIDVGESHHTLGIILQTQGKLVPARLHHLEAERIAKNLLDLDDSLTDAKRLYALCQYHLGAIELARGRLSLAAERHKEERHIIRALSEQAPGNLEWRHRLLTSHLNVAAIFAAQANYSRARDALRNALAIGRELHQLQQTDERALSGEARANQRFGDLALMEGDLSGAQESYERARKIMEWLVARDPPSAALRRGLSTCYTKLGNLHMEWGLLEQAGWHFEEDLRLALQLAADDPESAVCARDLSVSQNKMGDLQLALGDSKLAEHWYRKAHEIREAWARKDVDNAAWQHDLANSLRRVGDALSAGGRSEAMQWYLQALDIARRLVDKSPEDSQLASTLGEIERRTADAHLAAGSLETALSGYLAWLATTERLVSRAKGSSAWQRAMMEARVAVGQICEKLGRYEEAGNYYEMAYRDGRQRAGRFADSTEWQMAFARTCSRLGMFLVNTDPEKAFLLLNEAVTILRGLSVQGKLAKERTSHIVELEGWLSRLQGRSPAD